MYVKGHSPSALIAMQQQQASLRTSLLIEDASAHSDQAAAASSAPSKGRCFSRWLHAHFPDSRSRFAVVLAFLLALSVSIYWAYWTISQRWLYSNAHPVQSVSFERETSLPALLGLQFFWPHNLAPTHIVHRVVPFLTLGDGSAVNVTSVGCTNIMFGPTPTALCQQLDAEGQPFVWHANPPPSELDGSSALNLPTSSLPLQSSSIFNGGVLCFDVHLMVNATAAEQNGFFDLPVFSATACGLQPLLSELELIRAGHFVETDPAYMGVLDAWNSAQLTGFYRVGQRIELEWAATRTIQPNGAEQLDFQYASVGQYDHSSRYHDSEFAALLATITNQTEAAQWKALRADPNVAYSTARMCVGPSSFNVQVIRLQKLYGFTSFLSDAGQRAAGHSDDNGLASADTEAALIHRLLFVCTVSPCSGGFLNILSIVMFALFPVTYAITRPRSFLPVWLLLRWKQRGKAEPPIAERGSANPTSGDVAIAMPLHY